MKPTFQICITLLLTAVLPPLCQAQVQELNVQGPATTGRAATGRDRSAPRYAPTAIKAQWITHPDLSGGESAVVLFRRVFELPQKPERFVVNVSADNHYKLFVNGRQVCLGPQLSDIRHWRYETVDLAPLLQPGRNVLAAEVVNFGPDRFFGMQSYRTAFILNTPEPGTPVNVNTTAQTGWRVLHNRGVTHKPVRWRVRPEDRDIIGGFYAANPTDSLNTAAYPWGWEQLAFDDSGWKPAVFCEGVSALGGGFAWLLEPRNVPLQTQRQERLGRVATVSGLTTNGAFLQGNNPLVIPAKTRTTLLIDHGTLTIGYPHLHFSGGAGSTVRIGYAENLFIPNTARKGNRNQVEGRQFIGMRDVIVPDGSTGRVFRPTWLRTFRFIQLDVTTGDQPLTINDLYNLYTASPIPVKARFATDQPEYEQIFNICRRTVELCTQDYFLSDAYYETMQYLGDSKVHDLTWLALTGNDLHVRNALEQFHYSRLWDGNLTSCYPLRSTFVHPTYSVIWIDMLYDYLMHSGDKTFIRQFVPGIHQTLAMFDGLMQPNGLAGNTRWAYFVDWYSEPGAKGGLAPGQDGANSAVVTLHYVYALQNAARIFDLLGESDGAMRGPANRGPAETYRRRADQIRKQVYNLCYDTGRGLMAERPTRDYFDQHTNIMAVLTDALPASQQLPVLQKILADTSLGQATYYYRIYLFEALHKAAGSSPGAGELFDKVLQPWKAALADGLSTTPERFESPNKPTRSECHPWSTAPGYTFFSTLAGIRPAEPGFRSIRMEPRFGALSLLDGTYPLPMGEMVFRLEKKGRGLSGSIVLPEGVTGTLVWSGKTIPLKPGQQTINTP
ncbi:alpha-L-rhamnosidase [Fibrisoma montanum]|uniref:Alpha-L-rhamnosidase n=1 Tax=Fibrisoma montanum TaxID=2305895 RepID=A0A418MC70_9BACT|nr:alpha-L-rhamnosidase C-terminal domain-containing protein [Fibrisoma montanum]RIV23959.1 alpha-L-rhamnosidase [Fibrisoma montanum]